MPEIKDLLAVLDMTAEEQLKAVARLAWHHRKDSEVLAAFHREYKSGYMEMSLADLAFGLRDDLHYVIGELAWEEACLIVWRDWKKRIKSTSLQKPELKQRRWSEHWILFWADPIVWVITALIAKMLAKEFEAKQLANEK